MRWSIILCTRGTNLNFDTTNQFVTCPTRQDAQKSKNSTHPGADPVLSAHRSSLLVTSENLPEATAYRRTLDLGEGLRCGAYAAIRVWTFGFKAQAQDLGLRAFGLKRLRVYRH